MSQQCTTCFQDRESIINFSTATRPQALERFLGLQGEGYAPAMCESQDGVCTVCYDLAHRPLASRRTVASGLLADDRGA